MEPITKNSIKIARILEISPEKVQILFDMMSLTDLASLISAVNTNNDSEAKSIFSNYAEKLNSPKDDGKNFLMWPAKEKEEEFIPDPQVAEAVKNVTEMMNGGKSRKIITELAQFQRDMFYGMIPKAASLMIQKYIDATPIVVTQRYNKIHGIGQFEINENESTSYKDMIESIIETMLKTNEDFLDGIDNKKEEEKPKEDEKKDEKEPEKTDNKKEKSSSETLIDNIVQKKF